MGGIAGESGFLAIQIDLRLFGSLGVIPLGHVQLNDSIERELALGLVLGVPVDAGEVLDALVNIRRT